MGAAGLTSSAVEMAGKGGLGIELDLDRVPVRETGMTAYEIMLSESQERMLMILRARQRGRGAPRLREMGARFRGDRPGHRDRPAGAAHARRDRRRHPGRAAGRRGAALSSGPGGAATAEPEIDPATPARRATRSQCLKRLLACPDLASKRWIWEQYDHLVHGQHGQAAGRRRRGGPDRRERQGAGARHRLHAALLPRRPGARRRPGGGRELAQPDRGRRRCRWR